MKKTYLFAALFGLLIISVGAYAALFMTKPAPGPTASTQRPQQSAQPEPAPVTITLPDASSIPARHENYHKADSIWTIVSKDYPLADQQYVPKDLEHAPVPTNTSKSPQEQQIRSLIHTEITAFFSDAKKAGYDLFMASGYRSYELQKTYFDNYVRVSGEEEATKFSARPGTSEHQTGLSFDVSLSNRNCYLETCFGDTEAAKWLAANAYKYGFILRYPSDKTEITKYQYEPWHFRYVGKDLAAALRESKLSLDEAYEPLETALAELKKRGPVK